MGPIEIIIAKIKAIADAIRDRTGETAPMTLDEMAESIEYMTGDGGPMQTFILVDEDGHEMTATLTEEEVQLTATPNDIRIGTTAVTDSGVTVGEKEIPSYNTREGYRIVTNGSRFILPVPEWDYTKLQAIICPFASSLNASVSAEKVAIENSLYNVLSTEVVAEIEKDVTNARVDFGIINTSGNAYLIRYFMYKEIY